jgi:hypothetical protein
MLAERMSASPPSIDSSVLARTTARTLALGGWFAAFAMALTLGALAALATSTADRIGWVAAIVLGVVAIYYGLRAWFDQRLFDDLADRLASGVDEADALRALDASLARLGWRRAAPSPRPLGDRARGATRLLRGAAIATLAQLALSAALWLRDAPR